MAERSTAAVGVAEDSGDEETLTARADKAGVDSATDGQSSSDEIVAQRLNFYEISTP